MSHEAETEQTSALLEGRSASGSGCGSDDTVQSPRWGTEDIAPWSARGVIVGYVDELHGPSSRTANFDVSEFEARILARHWVGRIMDYDVQVIYGDGSPTGYRTATYARGRIGTFLALGLVDADQIDQTFEDVRLERGLPRCDEWERIDWDDVAEQEGWKGWKRLARADEDCVDRGATEGEVAIAGG